MGTEDAKRKAKKLEQQQEEAEAIQSQSRRVRRLQVLKQRKRG